MTRKSKKAVVVRPDPTPSEVEAMALAKDHKAARPARLRMTYSVPNPDKPESISAVPDHSDDAGFGDWLLDAWGTRSGDFVNDQMSKIARVTDKDLRKSETSGNAQLALIAGIAPRNELEGVLATQIAGTHELSMLLLAHAANASDVGIMERYVTMATKLQRNLTSGVEALSRLRGGGKQTVEVKHVYINGNAVVGDGNQALFGNDRGGRWGRISKRRTML